MNFTNDKKISSSDYISNIIHNCASQKKILKVDKWVVKENAQGMSFVVSVCCSALIKSTMTHVYHNCFCVY